MKKSLLSLLAVALTVVSCQNYDDQFESLTDQITQLSETVAGLTAVKDQVTALQQTVNGLATSSALTALAGVVNSNATAIDAATAATSAVALQVASTQASIAQILLDLENVATDADLAAISNTLATVQADVRELLQGNATINQSVTINNEATLIYAETLIATATDRPNVIVNGLVTVNTTGFSQSQVDRTNAILGKLATVLDDVSLTSTHSLSLPKLTFIDADLTIIGVAQGIGELRTITGDLTVTQIGAIDFSFLTSANDVQVIASEGAVTNVNSITSVDFGNAKLNSLRIGAAGVAANTINTPKALTVKTGNAPVIDITATAATDIDHNYNGTAALASLSITGSGTIDILASKVTGAITLEGVKTSIIYASSLTSTNAFTMTTKVAQLHLPKITQASGAINATVVDLTAFQRASAALNIAATDVDLTGATAIAAPAITHSGKGHVTITDANETGLLGAATTQITILDLSGPVDFQAAMLELHTVNITGKAAASGAAQNNLVTTSSAASMTTITLGGTIDGLVSAGNTKLKTVTTSGNLTDMTITGATALTAVNAGHSYISGDTAVTFVITGATALQTLDMSSVDRVKTITLTGNTKLHTVTAPSTTTLCEAGAAVAVSVTASLSGVFVPYKPAIAATETTPAIPAKLAKIKQNSLKSLSDWYDAHINRQTASPTFAANTYLVSGTNKYLNFDAATAAQAYGQAVPGTGSGTIDVFAEINLIEAE